MPEGGSVSRRVSMGADRGVGRIHATERRCKFHSQLPQAIGESPAKMIGKRPNKIDLVRACDHPCADTMGGSTLMIPCADFSHEIYRLILDNKLAEAPIRSPEYALDSELCWNHILCMRSDLKNMSDSRNRNRYLGIAIWYVLAVKPSQSTERLSNVQCSRR